MNKVTRVFSVNGEEHEVSFRPHKTLLEVLREDMNLTGADGQRQPLENKFLSDNNTEIADFEYGIRHQPPPPVPGGHRGRREHYELPKHA